MSPGNMVTMTYSLTFRGSDVRVVVGLKLNREGKTGVWGSAPENFGNYALLKIKDMAFSKSHPSKLCIVWDMCIKEMEIVYHVLFRVQNYFA